MRSRIVLLLMLVSLLGGIFIGQTFNFDELNWNKIWASSPPVSLDDSDGADN